ncbi:DNA REPAIR polymerase UMUC / TRANSFERASE FAMILY MEMBER [Salix purpurea]|uniref:DNA polymerase kappa n=1 Tax=Salix purpurea TaxID=77065 RepID=A0A9Q0VTR3_SALPP|nr:DNA REPAIR polymerase UMUC / TRANSFERASE FAMILY MEMBER [Salix purpurea]
MEKNETLSGDKPRPWQSYHTVYTNAKAGMEGVDKEKVQRIVYETSKGSKYFENEEKKEALLRQKIENMRAQRAKLSAADLSHYQTVADRRILELEATRDLSRIWLHADMDAFYAAVETLSNPSLKGKPMAVGGMSMISTANYEARRFGVRAAMPGFIARKLCPELIFVPTDFKKYTHYSELTRKVFEKYDPNFMAASLDEAYLDITEVCKERSMSGGEIAEELRKCVNEETGLTCSAGVAPNRLLAKVCSDINKPNGQFVLTNDRMAVMTFIFSLPIRKIGGIGKVTEHILRDAFGISTCEEMLQKGGLLCALFSHSTADTPQVSSRKSISSERTFSATADETLLYQKLADIAEMLYTDMKKEGLYGRTLTLKLKTASFEVRSRAVTLEKYICSSEDILKHASKLLKAELPISLRLMGLRMSHFNEDKIGSPSDPTQKTLNNFIVSADLSRKNLDDSKSLGSDINDLKLMNNMEGSFSIEIHELQCYGIRDPLDSNNLQDLNVHHCTSTDSVEAKKIREPSSNKIADKVITKDMEEEVSQWKESGLSLPGQLEGESPDRLNQVIMDNEAVFSSEQKDGLVWVDDYKCSLCGIEMPPYFEEERQEHSDFHLAERLQKEESSFDTRTSTLRQRSVKKDRISSQSKRKRHKPSPKKGRHLSIDMFFAKSNQNF